MWNLVYLVEEPHSSVLDKIIASDNLVTVLAANVAMTMFAADEGIMNSLIANAIAFPLLLTSTAAKAAIFASSTLMTIEIVLFHLMLAVLVLPCPMLQASFLTYL